MKKRSINGSLDFGDQFFGGPSFCGSFLLVLDFGDQFCGKPTFWVKVSDPSILDRDFVGSPYFDIDFGGPHFDIDFVDLHFDRFLGLPNFGSGFWISLFWVGCFGSHFDLIKIEI